MNFSDLIYSIQKGSEMILITEKGSKLILSSLENELVSGFSEISYLIKVDDLKKLKDEQKYIPIDVFYKSNDLIAVTFFRVLFWFLALRI